MAEKLFSIQERPSLGQTVIPSTGLGRILHRPEVKDIVARFGSTAKISSLDNYMEIIPPIAKSQLPKLGEALVSLAHSLDSSDPPAIYSIDVRSDDEDIF